MSRSARSSASRCSTRFGQASWNGVIEALESRRLLTAIVSGERVLGAILNQGGSDSYTFTADAGDAVILSLGEIDTNWAPRLEVFSPMGDPLGAISGSGSAGANDFNLQVELFNLAESGTYTAVVSGVLTSTGEYALSLARAPGAQPFDQGPLVSGERKLGALDRGDLDVFTFDAISGESVILSLGEQTNWAPQLDVYSPTGQRLDFVAGSGSAGANNFNMQIELLNLAQTGTYFAVVRAAGGGSVGEYVMTMLRLPGAQPFDEGPLVTGQQKMGIVDRGDLDVFTFAAAAGETVIFSLGELTNWAPQLDVYSPSGVRLDSVAGSGSAGANNFNMQIELLNLAEGGTYFAVVRAAAGTSVGEYVMTMLRLPAAQPFDDGPFLSNQRAFGSVDRGDLDVFTFEADAGDSVLLSMGELANWAPRLDVFSPSGVRLDTVAGSGSAGALNYNMHIELLNLSESGTYFAVTRANAGGSVGEYALSLARLPASQAADTTDNDGGPIASGQTTTGAIAAGDLDVYTLALTSGASATIQMMRLTSSFASRLDLFGPDGARLAFHSGSPTATINLPAAPQTGTYYIVARTTTAGQVGNYSIAVDTSPGSDTRPPQVTGSDFLWNAPQQQIVFTMSESVAGSLSAGDLTLQNLTTGQPVPAANMSVSFNTPGNRIIFEFPGYEFGALPDGDYRATLNAGSVEDAAGNALAADQSFDFFFLNGDANRDRRVDLTDFNILATNFGRFGRTFAQGDFTYNGSVNLSDFNELAARFGSELARPVAVAAAAIVPSRTAFAPRGPLVSDDLEELL